MGTASIYDVFYSVGRRLRWTVVLASIAFIAGALATFYWHSEVFASLLAPAGAKLSPFEGKPTVTVPTAMFGATIDLSLLGGKLAAFPFLIAGSLSLLQPLTPPRWWRFIVANVLIGIALFVLGDVFVYFVMLPVSMDFLLSFGTSIVEPTITLDSYLELLFSLFKWIGIVFMLPLFMNILARVRVLSYQRAKGAYRVNILLVAFFGALISPGFDSTITLMIAPAMYSLYLIGLGGVWMVDTSQGNYLWLKTIGRALRKLWRWITWPPRKAWSGLRWLLRKACAGLRWLVGIWWWPF